MKRVGRFALLPLWVSFALLLVALVPSASANPVTFNITNANCGLSCGTVPPNTVLGTVSLVLNPSGSVTVTIALNPAFTFIVPDGNDINFNLGNSTVGNVSVSNFFSSKTGAPGTFTNPLTFSSLNSNSNVGGGLGVFAVTLFHVTDVYKPQQPLDYITFTLTNSSGPYTLADLLNSSWAFHLGNCPQPLSGCNATTTGFVGTGAPPTTVPEPGTGALAMMGVGLLFLGNFMRRRLHRQSVS